MEDAGEGKKGLAPPTGHAEECVGRRLVPRLGRRHPSDMGAPLGERYAGASERGGRLRGERPVLSQGGPPEKVTVLFSPRFRFGGSRARARVGRGYYRPHRTG